MSWPAGEVLRGGLSVQDFSVTYFMERIAVRR